MHTVPDEQSKMEMGLPSEAPRTSGISETQPLNCEKIILIVSFITKKLMLKTMITGKYSKTAKDIFKRWHFSAFSWHYRLSDHPKCVTTLFYLLRLHEEGKQSQNTKTFLFAQSGGFQLTWTTSCAVGRGTELWETPWPSFCWKKKVTPSWLRFRSERLQSW